MRRRRAREAPLWWVRAVNEAVAHGVPDTRLGRPDGWRVGQPGTYLAVCGRPVLPAPSHLSSWVPRCRHCRAWARRWADLPWPQLPWREPDFDDD
ncbi:hypothetical protein [Streptoalloteichus hindustanus]|uniref:Zinc-finger n=1 Tax=Streptoalloteichus hindustanus TaxID=2017 RepID=A0A1M5GD91_STRHI|nr:hypothetical protein [Streptoalloteichus hindustanus]SHG01648.1 hypothetical protein SAMN05444320_10669 [Streptoalloteichus hindustanus]